MPRGRKPLAASPTGFLNTKRRVIYRSSSGKYYSKSEDGTHVYNPKAKYHKSPGGTERATKFLRNTINIPVAIRPKFERQTRSNYGEPRGKYAPRAKGVRVLPMKRKAYITEMFEGYAPKRPVGRPRKVVLSPSEMIGLAGMKIVGQRKTRRNKGAKRGPRQPKKLMYRIKLGGVYVA